jgi:hypothetical protein
MVTAAHRVQIPSATSGDGAVAYSVCGHLTCYWGLKIGFENVSDVPSDSFQDQRMS